MRSELIGNFKLVALEFPWLGIDSSTEQFVVLFTSRESNTRLVGTIVWIRKEVPGGHRLGDYAENWLGECFKLFNGEVRLAND